MLHRYLPTKGKVLKWRIFRHRAWHESENQLRQKGRSTCICLSTYLPACKLLKSFYLRQMAGGLAAFAGPELLVGSVNAHCRILHVPQCRRARRIGIAISNGLRNYGMLITHLLPKIFTPRFIDTRHADRRLQKLTQKFQQRGIERIVRRLGYSRMESEIFLHAIPALQNRFVDVLQCLLDAQVLRPGPPLSRQRGHLTLHTAPQLNHAQHRLNRVLYIDIEAKRRGVVRRQNDSAAASARPDQSFRFEP